MNTDYLHYFSTLAELQHYGNAAKALNISQPGLSHAIRSLEEEFGLPLFEKTGRNVRLSPYGVELKKHIDVILNGLDELDQKISDFHREDKVIRIASVYPLAGSFIPELIQSCSVKFPFAIYNGMTPDILQGLENMTYDLGFCSAQPSSELFEYCPVQKSYVGIVVPKGHELISKEAFTFRDITTYPQIFFTRTSPMRKLQEQIYKDYQIPTAPACEAEEIEVILNMIEHGFGISVLPYLDIFKNRNVDVLPLSETKWESTFYAIRRRDGVRSQGEKTIWSQIIHNSKRDRLEF
mgnify:FL=1